MVRPYCYIKRFLLCSLNSKAAGANLASSAQNWLNFHQSNVMFTQQESKIINTSELHVKVNAKMQLLRELKKLNLSDQFKQDLGEPEVVHHSGAAGGGILYAVCSSGGSDGPSHGSVWIWMNEVKLNQVPLFSQKLAFFSTCIHANSHSNVASYLHE